MWRSKSNISIAVNTIFFFPTKKTKKQGHVKLGHLMDRNSNKFYFCLNSKAVQYNVSTDLITLNIALKP